MSPLEFLWKAKIRLIDLGVKNPLLNSKWPFTFSGSPYTMAPEVKAGLEYDSSADIFSAGVIFYQLLTGRYLQTEVWFSG
jgi:serine/threonine protein kinase